MATTIETRDERKERFTPGPWCFTNGNLLRVCKANHDPITICGVHRIGKLSGKDEGEAIANGLLIATAPSLYAALQALVREIESGDIVTSAWPQMEKARAALAKARGEG